MLSRRQRSKIKKWEAGNQKDTQRQRRRRGYLSETLVKKSTSRRKRVSTRRLTNPKTKKTRTRARLLPQLQLPSSLVFS
jgi:hypothetical protein